MGITKLTSVVDRARMQNANFKKITSLPISRKIHMNAWGVPSDPSVYCRFDVNVTPVFEYLNVLQEKIGQKITINHFVAKSVGYCLESFPTINRVLIKNNFYQRPNICVYFMTHLDTYRGYDMARFLIQDINEKSLVEVAQIVRDKSRAIKSGRDLETEQIRKLVNKLPNSIFVNLLKILDFLIYRIRLNLSDFGFSQAKTGGAIVSAIGSLGVEESYVPLSHFSRCPLVFAIGKARKMPVVVDDRIEIATISTITFTYDHRYMDGIHSAEIQNLLKNMFANPESYKNIFESSSCKIS